MKISNKTLNKIESSLKTIKNRNGSVYLITNSNSDDSVFRFNKITERSKKVNINTPKMKRENMLDIVSLSESNDMVIFNDFGSSTKKISKFVLENLDKIKSKYIVFTIINGNKSELLNMDSIKKYLINP